MSHPKITRHQLRFSKHEGRVVVDVEDLLTLLRDFEDNRRQHRKIRAAAGDAANVLREMWLHLTDPRA